MDRPGQAPPDSHPDTTLMRAIAQAQPNIALIKYWGKRDVDKNLPAVSSLSVTLDTLWTKMSVEFATGNGPDELQVNGTGRPDRLDKTTPVWPIANVHIPGYDRNEMMATHMSNHIVMGYGDILQELIATCRHLGIKTRVAGDAGKALKK